MFCIHSWRKIEDEPIKVYVDYTGFKVGLFACQCKKCGKRRFIKFY